MLAPGSCYFYKSPIVVMLKPLTFTNSGQRTVITR